VIDLHFHSDHSDGSDSPRTLVDLAMAVVRDGQPAPLRAIALTDHDTLSGLPEFRAAAEAAGIECIPGCEISAKFEDRSLHLLVYFADAEDSPLGAMLAELRDDRLHRNDRLIARCNEAGYPITMAEVAAKAGTEAGIGRPHFAEVFVDKGYASTIQEVFDRFLASGGPLYIPKSHFTPAEVADVAHRSGGVCVLAHPFLAERDPAALSAMVATLVEDGIDGLECYYSRHSDEQRAFLLALADEHGIVATGGSDYHGNKKPDLKIGVGQGNLAVPDDVLDALRAARPVVS
jgi:3',5'-nucleoside bisphosphate phosphatase